MVHLARPVPCQFLSVRFNQAPESVHVQVGTGEDRVRGGGGVGAGELGEERRRGTVFRIPSARQAVSRGAAGLGLELELG